MDLSDAVIGQYQVIEQISKGGMATVYKAYQPNLDRCVAIKVLTPDKAETQGFIARFEQEARAIAKLRHRNILTVFDYGRQDGLFYLVMEYVGGGTLKARLGWPQDLAYTVNVVSQVGDALAHAHRQGLIHRDVKPTNILMAEEDWPLLSDFGLTKLLEASPQLTASGASVGTPQYMSPEQAQGFAVDQRCDIYSLGVVLYEVVTGRPPFGSDSPMIVILRHIHDPITPPHILRPDLPKGLEQIILKALAKSPDDRYQRMEDLIADLKTAHPASDGHNLIRDKLQTSPKWPSTDLPVSTSRVSSSFPSHKKLFRWAGLSIGAALLFALALFALLFKNSSSPTASALAETVTLTPLPSAVANTATLTPSTSPMPSSPTVPPPPTAEPTTPSSQVMLQPQVMEWEIDGAEMVFVPAGKFVMGSEELGDDERPVHQIYLDDFWIDRHEVTNQRFAHFVDQTGYQTQAESVGWGWVARGAEWEKVEGADWRHPSGPSSSIEDKMDHPVVLVSWNDADAYCRWAEKYLPSEAQWEKAARGPSTDLQPGRRYAWGDAFDATRTNTEESGQGSTTPVGGFSPQGDSPYGAADMTGNVWEWVADWYDSAYYNQSPPTNPPGPTSGTYKVLRGGSWLFDEVYARSAFRYNVKPDYTYDFTGFRCSRQ